ncbi:MAG: N-acetylmuramoyl-L-alanine amidase [Clostridia bacterium]|nr:N-acetylmuramoyl-L-alanine amidase [Clostridia bacterium]
MIKRLLCTVVTTLILLMLFAQFAFAAESDDFPLGDADQSGSVTAMDAAEILRHVVRLTTLSGQGAVLADVNMDGEVTAFDASCILRYIVRLDTLPPSGSVVNPPEAIDLSGKIIILDPGHGYDLATGILRGGRMTDENGALIYAEADRVLDFALETKALLEEHGATVVLTRSDRFMVGNYVRVSMTHKLALSRLHEMDSALLNATDSDAEREGLESRLSDYEYLSAIMDAIIGQYTPGRTEDNGELAQIYYFTPYDSSHGRVIHPDTRRIYEYEKDARLSDMVYISLHTNASASSQAGQNRGLLVYCTDNSYNPTYYDGYQSENSIRLGELLNEQVSAATGLIKRRDYVVINDYFMTRENNLPAVLLEIGYHDNAEDLAIISAAQTPQNVAKGILAALGEYFG